MAQIRERDLQQASEFLGGLYSCRSPQEIARYTLTEMSRLVGSDQTTWNHVAPARGFADVMAWPEEDNHMRHQDALRRNAADHPLIQYFLKTGDMGAFKISDFLSVADFHNSALYDELYRPLGYEDQFAMNLLSAQAPEGIVVVVARDRRTFTERDRALLNLVRPHIAQAMRQVRLIRRLVGRLERERDGPSSAEIVLDRHGRILRCSARAQRWLEIYFDDLPCAPNRLPKALEDSLLERHRKSQDAFDGRLAPLTRRRRNRSLVIWPPDSVGSDELVLLLEERPEILFEDTAAELGLSSREFEVLCLVQDGCRNREIASALGISLRTVKKHVEHIFAKLGVTNRTAAAAKLRGRK